MRIRSTKPEFGRSKTIAVLPWLRRLVRHGEPLTTMSSGGHPHVNAERAAGALRAVLCNRAID
jgi:hypothetical protein